VRWGSGEGMFFSRKVILKITFSETFHFAIQKYLPKNIIFEGKIIVAKKTGN
jgi:hypothetical protein